MNRTDVALVVALLVAGIVVPGVVNHVLHRAGFPLFGTLAWVVGFGTLVVGAWALWLRDLDLTGAVD